MLLTTHPFFPQRKGFKSFDGKQNDVLKKTFEYIIIASWGSSNLDVTVRQILAFTRHKQKQAPISPINVSMLADY